MSRVDDRDDGGAARSGYHPATGRFHAHHDDEDGEISTSVIEAVAAVTGDAPESVEPLYDVVDPDALDTLVSSFTQDERSEVTFTLNDCMVTVRGSGTIELEPDR